MTKILLNHNSQTDLFNSLFKVGNQIAGKLMKYKFCNFLQPAQNWINKVFVRNKKYYISAIEICYFKSDVIKW